MPHEMFERYKKINAHCMDHILGKESLNIFVFEEQNLKKVITLTAELYEDKANYVADLAKSIICSIYQRFLDRYRG